MAETIDSLQIEINAKATKANDAIDRLVGKLDRLTTSLSKINGTNLNGLANGVQRLGNAMQIMNNVSTADFTRLASNLTKLGSVNVSALNSAASSMSHLTRAFNSLGTVSANAQAVGDMAKNIAKLGNKSVQTAITNIPQLATAMNNLMTTLSRSPQVSRNIIDMTNALANLASQGSKVGSASKNLVGGLNNSSRAAVRAKKNFGGLASAIGKFYATYFMVIRGLKGLWKSIESTADYIEAYNYFNVALGKIGSDWSYQFEKYGYDNAESYANSFSKILSERLGKLSGLKISVGADGKGLLTETGMKNLGLNIQEITQYASQLASVTNSVGQTGETSLAIASSFTKLAGDISSLFNVDYSSVAKNLQSGFIGQSRALYKYGIDITNATLQTKAYELGLSKSVSEMSQAEKMQLRMLVILKDSKVAWGDLANTINSPSNMIRQFKNNLKETGLVLGQLFIPVLEKVMPVVNGTTIAIKNLLVSIAGLMGVKIDLDAFGQGYTNIEDDVDGITDSYEDATKAAKEWKNQLLGFDEVNKLSEPTDAQTSVGGIDLTNEIIAATEEYEKVWNKAYQQMKNNAQKFAKKIEKALSPIVNPFKNLFKNISDGNWFLAGQNVNQMATALLGFVNTAIDEVDWEEVGKNIGEFLAGLNWTDLLAKALRTSFKLWEAVVIVIKESFEEEPISTSIITCLAALKLTGLDTVVGGMIAKKIFSGISTSFASLGGLGGILTMDLATIMGAGTVAEIGLTIGVGIIGGIAAAIAGWNLGQVLYEALSGDSIDMSWTEQFTYLFRAPFENIESFIDGLVITLTDFKNNPVLTTMASSIAGPFGVAAAYIYKYKDEIVGGINNIVGKFNEFKGKLSEKWTGLQDWFYDYVLVWFDSRKWTFDGIKNGLKLSFSNGISAVKQVWNDFAKWLNSKLTWKIEPVYVAGNKIFDGTTINLGRIPTFQTGGFPEDGLFMANHDELVGRFSNGKTAVANNAQITDGIRQAAYEGMRMALSEYQGGNTNVNITLQGDADGLFRAVQDKANNYTAQTGRPAFNI